jgi:ferredoxin
MDGHFVIAFDGTGYLFFKKKHCDKCIVHKHENHTYYFHPVLEAKIVDPRGFALSVGNEFIENDSDDFEEYKQKKQDCELKAFKRLAPVIKKDFPQTPICITGDSIYACGPCIQICKENKWHFVLTFKRGGLPAVWEDVQGLLKLCPENSLTYKTPDGVIQHYRWVNDVSYQDSQKRTHTFDAIICKETRNNETKTFAWITDFQITSKNVLKIATQGGRVRSKIENQGFNIQKNSGLNLEHAYSFDTDVLKSFYCLLQIAHIILQMVEKGSLLKNLAKQFGKSAIDLFGSLKNIARRLLECFRCYFIPNDAFDRLKASQIQIRLDSS